MGRNIRQLDIHHEEVMAVTLTGRSGHGINGTTFPGNSHSIKVYPLREGDKKAKAEKCRAVGLHFQPIPRKATVTSLERSKPPPCLEPFNCRIDGMSGPFVFSVVVSQAHPVRVTTISSSR
ncbi:hypothetical protein AAC387_Pa05g0789 [Persea americana]